MGGHPEENMTLNSIFFTLLLQKFSFFVSWGAGEGGILNAHAGIWFDSQQPFLVRSIA